MRLTVSIASLGLGLALVGCGGSSYEYSEASAASPGPAADYAVGAAGGAAGGESYGADYERTEPGSALEAEEMVAADSGGGFGGNDWYDEVEAAPADGSADRRTETDSSPEMRARYAQATPPARQQPQGTQTGSGTTHADEATDATSPSGPLLIYTAQVTLAVYEVEQTQDRILESLHELEGFLAHRTSAELVVRVPAARFERAMALIEEAGDVLDRNIEVQDVSEEFHDLQIRIQNAEAMRDRLEQLLARANDVEGALAIERELQRITDFIERSKGRQRFLADRISFSTITVYFRPLSTEPANGPDGFVLPFPWLDELGLSNLLRL